MALLLGAGASVDAGLPTSTEIIHDVRSHLNEQMRARFDAAGGAPESRQTIETVFTRLAESYGPSSELPVTILKVLKARLASNDIDAASYLSELIHYGSPIAISTYQPVFTLNYDTLFEDACRRSVASHWYARWQDSGFPLADFLQEHVLTGVPDVAESYGCIPHECRGDVEATMDSMRRSTIPRWSSSPTIHIHKLHGSLDWFRAYGTDDQPTYPLRWISPVFEPLGITDYATLASKHRQFAESFRNVVALRSQAHQFAFSTGETRYVSCMIFGGTTKLTTTYPFFYLQSRFEKVVRNVWLLVVIGYSFRDPYLNQLIRTRIRGGFNPHFFPWNDHQRSKTLVVAPHAWNLLGADVTTIDGENTGSRHTAAMYCNSTARTFAARYRQLVDDWWVDHVTNETPWRHLEDQNRYFAL